MCPFRRAVSCLCILLLSSCARGPSRDEALAALRAMRPEVDSIPIVEMVWRDGPPWFSCSEVVAKLRSGVDSLAVRRQVGNWHDLVRAGWIVVRDTASGPVADPGWCAAQLTPVGTQQSQAWAPLAVAGFPTGGTRRGWSVPAGVRRVAVDDAPRATSDSEATVRYLEAVVPNANGRVLGSARDTARFTATIVRRDGRWVVRKPSAIVHTETVTGSIVGR